jgi:hypothetical protein
VSVEMEIHEREEGGGEGGTRRVAEKFLNDKGGERKHGLGWSMQWCVGHEGMWHTLKAAGRVVRPQQASCCTTYFVARPMLQTSWSVHVALPAVGSKIGSDGRKGDPVISQVRASVFDYKMGNFRPHTSVG